MAHADAPAPEVLARYGDTITITSADFAAALRGLPAHVREQARSNPKTATQLLEMILTNRVLAKEARDLGLDRQPEVAAELRQVDEKALAVRRFEAIDASLTIPDYTKAAREQYDLNKAKYLEAEQVEAAHVLIATANEHSEAEALKLAQEVRTKALAGTDFAELAKEYSSDPGSKKNGGSLGFFGRGRMVKPFEEAAFALPEIGAISEPVKTPFGYHVVKLLGRKPGRQKSFEEVKDSIIAPMRAQFTNAEHARILSAIRNSPDIKLDTAAIDRAIGVAADANAAAPVTPPAAKP
jgi:peptidyl-prolyl cis-trans isomerase C